MEKRYFTPLVSNANIIKMKALCVNGASDTRLSLDEKMMVCKLKEGDTSTHDCFDGVPEFTENQIKTEMKKAAWKGVIEN